MLVNQLHYSQNVIHYAAIGLTLSKSFVKFNAGESESLTQ